MSHGHLNYFHKPPLGGRPNTKPRDHGTPNTHNHCIILFDHVWRPAWIKIHWNSIWLRTQSHMASHYSWGSMTTLHDGGGLLGRPLDSFLLGSHNSMVTALSSCVKWPLHVVGLLSGEPTWVVTWRFHRTLYIYRSILGRSGSWQEDLSDVWKMGMDEEVIWRHC
jgi:hypothetical protein